MVTESTSFIFSLSIRRIFIKLISDRTITLPTHSPPSLWFLTLVQYVFCFSRRQYFRYLSIRTPGHSLPGEELLQEHLREQRNCQTGICTQYIYHLHQEGLKICYSLVLLFYLEKISVELLVTQNMFYRKSWTLWIASAFITTSGRKIEKRPSWSSSRETLCSRSLCLRSCITEIWRWKSTPSQSLSQWELWLYIQVDTYNEL